MMTMRQFVTRNNIRIACDFADSNPNMADSASMNHYRVTLRMDRRQMSLIFSQGFGIHGEPSAEDVLSCLASDASTIENTSTFEDWVDDYGYDNDSRTAERIYLATKRQTEKLRRFMGDKYDTLRHTYLV